MGVNTDYLGHVEIRAVTESSRVCLAGPLRSPPPELPIRRTVRRHTRGHAVRGVSFDHEMNGVIVGEQGDSRELFYCGLSRTR
jgi:hypothetical protein